MNRTYRTVWNDRLCAFVATAEFTQRTGMAAGAVVGGLLSAVLMVSPVSAQGLAPQTLPAGAQVIAGSATIHAQGSTLNITQTSPRAAINWQSFNVGRDATVQFQQPNASAVTLNRVVGNEASVIDGAIKANGSVWLLNGAGVLFNGSAQVDVGGLVASTLNISDNDFMAGGSSFERSGGRGSVINRGRLTAAPGGYIALLGQQVLNEGTITANMGSAMLAAGDKISLSFDGNALIGLTIDKGTLDGLVDNKLAIYAAGGKVLLSSQALDTVLDGAVNNSGVIQANAVASGQNGDVVLFAHGGTMNLGGTVRAEGGSVETSGQAFNIQPGANVSAGQWLIDPVNITVDSTLASAVSSALNTGNVTLQTSGACSGVTCSGTAGAGDITVGSAITKSAGTRTQLTLAADRDITVNASISGSNGNPLDLVLASRVNGGTTGGVYVGANLKTYGGDLTIGGGDLQASGYAITHSSTPYGDNKSGVFIGQAIVDATSDGSGTANTTLPSATSGGDITIRGKGDLNTAHQFNAGVYFYINKTIGIVTGGSGNILIDGQGGKASGHFWDVGAVGVLWESSTTYIKANHGDVIIHGTAGTVADRFGIATSNTFIGTNGYLGIQGDSFLNRGGTISLNIGGSGDISAPMLGTGAPYTLSKSGAGTVNVEGDAAAWHANRPSGTSDTQTVGTFIDSTNTINLVNLTRNQALYAFSTVPSTITTVTQSTATPTTGGGGTAPPVTDVSYTFSALSGTSVYNGNAYTLSSLWSASTLFGSAYSGWLAGTDYSFKYAGNTVSSFTNAGSYSGVTVDILKSGYAVASSGNTAGSFSIVPKTLSLSAAKVYDGGTLLSNGQVSLGGLVNNQTLGFSGAILASKNVGAGNYVAAIALQDGSNGGLASNYQLPALNAQNAVAAVSAKPLNVVGAVAGSKVYDGGTMASVSGGTLQGLVGGDDVSLNQSGQFADKNVGTAKTVAAGMSIAGNDVGNYQLTQPTGLSADISAKALSVVGATAAGKVYDGSTAAHVSGGTLQGLVSGDNVSLSQSGQFADKNVGIAKAVAAGMSIAGDDAGNYQLVQPAGLSADIGAKTLSASGTTAVSRVYDGTTAATVILGQVSGVLPQDEPLSITTTASYDSAAVGVGKSVSVVYNAHNPNYIVLGSLVTGNITPAYGSGVDQVVAQSQNQISQASQALSTADWRPSPSQAPRDAGADNRALVIATPAGLPELNLVTLGEARIALGNSSSASSASSGSNAAGTSSTGPTAATSSTPQGQDVRVPALRGSITQIVDGGVRLPVGVEQAVFLVKR